MAWNAGPACAGISGRPAWNPQCFNFKDSEPKLFGDLAALTKSAYASYKEQGFV